MDIFIFDDHDMLRKGLKTCFSDSALYTAVGEAENLVNAKKVISAYKPNPASQSFAVAIVDVGFRANAKDCETVQALSL